MSSYGFSTECIIIGQDGISACLLLWMLRWYIKRGYNRVGFPKYPDEEDILFTGKQHSTNQLITGIYITFCIPKIINAAKGTVQRLCQYKRRDMFWPSSQVACTIYGHSEKLPDKKMTPALQYPMSIQNKAEVRRYWHTKVSQGYRD